MSFNSSFFISIWISFFQLHCQFCLLLSFYVFYYYFIVSLCISPSFVLLLVHIVFFICSFSLVSHPAFIFLSRFLRGIMILSLTSFTPAYSIFFTFHYVILSVGISLLLYLYFCFRHWLFQTRFLRDDNDSVSSDTFFLGNLSRLFQSFFVEIVVMLLISVKFWFMYFLFHFF